MGNDAIRRPHQAVLPRSIGESVNKSSTISSLAAALAKAQADFPPIPRDRTVTVRTRTGGEYKFSYAPLDTIMEKIRPTLKANGLAFLQCLNGEFLTTTLLHSSGEWMESDPMPVKVVEPGSQAMGSAITYARRYALTALLGLVTEDDDDGNTADGNAVDDASTHATVPAKRETAEKKCPACGSTSAIIKGKAEYGGGWVCFKKKGGCGAKLADDAFNDHSPAPSTAGAPPPPSSAPSRAASGESSDPDITEEMGKAFINADQHIVIMDELKGLKNGEARLKNAMKIIRLTAIRAGDYEKAVNWIKAQKVADGMK